MTQHMICSQRGERLGSIFKIGGKEYALNEQRKLDIPYGEDIFDIEFPDHFQGEITE